MFHRPAIATVQVIFIHLFIFLFKAAVSDVVFLAACCLSFPVVVVVTIMIVFPICNDSRQGRQGRPRWSVQVRGGVSLTAALCGRLMESLFKAVGSAQMFVLPLWSIWLWSLG